MGARGDFKFNIGEIINSHGRNLKIIDQEYRPKTVYKNQRAYTNNQKFYKYKCLNCGNEGWIIEYSIEKTQHCGCNACCIPPKKVVKGINDIATSANWMVKYFQNIEDASRYTKYSKEVVNFVCPECGRVHSKAIHNVMSNKGLSCICGDGFSYPNKFIYSMLEQLNIEFETEKRFEWSDNRIYDFYIEHNTKKNNH